jgi:FADH2 O2-dependent halogenase
MIDVDVLVVGSGFSGSIMAAALSRVGRRVALVERGRHPRFAIGESSTPLANLLLEEIADGYDLPELRAFSKWGTWQRDRPDVACGVKRGFSFFFHEPGAPFADDEEHERQLLVAASPHDGVADTHWYRPEFDHALVAIAIDAGAIYSDNTTVDRLTWQGDRVLVELSRQGTSTRLRCDFVVDASGPRGFLHRLLALPERPLRWLPRTEGVYTHFCDVGRWDSQFGHGGLPPYPIDDAALHHVFPGGWIWVLRFNNGLTSAGAALTPVLARRIRAEEGEGGWQRLLEQLPSVAAQFARARPVVPFVHSPRIAFHSEGVVGDKWALLPSAAGVIDPLLSTGFPLTLLGVQRLLQILTETRPGAGRQAALAAYAARTHAEIDVTESLVAALYSAMDDPALFKRLSRLYFAAASFSEAARRLNRPELAPGFLLIDHPTFGKSVVDCAERALTQRTGAGRTALFEAIDRLIEPFDIAGLADAARKHWYPVLADDLIGAAPKLGVSAEEIYALLARSGFAPSHHSSKASDGGPTRKSAYSGA